MCGLDVHTSHTYLLNKHTLIREADREIFNITTTLYYTYVYAFGGQQMGEVEKKTSTTKKRHILYAHMHLNGVYIV